jgi:polyisoprenoid-binding protein YceI
MNRHNLFLMALLASIAVPAEAVEYNRFRADKSRLSFVSTQMGVPVEGAFRRFDARLAVDPERPQDMRASVEIDMTSVDAGSKEADEEVIGPNWFDAGRFPTARFDASQLRPLGGNKWELRGRMTLKGRSAELVLPVSLTPSGNATQIEGGFVLKRLQWGIGQGPWGDPGTVADEVRIQFRLHAEATPAKPGKR